MLFINDYSNSTSCLPRFFANDAFLIISNKQPSLLETQINEELFKVLTWCNAKKLNINPSKWIYQVIPPKLITPTPIMCITLNNSVLSTGENVKCLGTNIDPHFNFLTHIKSIEHKISRFIGIIYKLKHFLPKLALLKIYYAVIHPYFPYAFALLAWGSTYPTYMSKLCILQNKAIKPIYDGKKSDHVTPYYSKLNILKLQDLYKHEVAKIVFRFSRGNLSPTPQHLFSKTSEIFFRNTRFSTNIYNLYIL